jgi:RNA polymerase sigma-70 factor (ECF subfamily)
MMADADLLFTEHQPSVYRYLCRVVGQAEMARDLTQEVFLRVTRAGAPADRDGQRAWIFGIARNLALNHLRDRSRRPIAVELVEGNRPATQELSVALDRALASLETLDRDTFLLREISGLSYEEIAAACDLTVPAVRCRLHRARQHLREQLAPSLAERRTAGVRLASSRDSQGH